MVEWRESAVELGGSSDISLNLYEYARQIRSKNYACTSGKNKQQGSAVFDGSVEEDRHKEGCGEVVVVRTENSSGRPFGAAVCSFFDGSRSLNFDHGSWGSSTDRVICKSTGFST